MRTVEPPQGIGRVLRQSPERLWFGLAPLDEVPWKEETMVTGYPQVLVGPQTAVDAAEVRRVTGSVVTRTFRRLGQLLCGLSGHDLVRHYEQNRVGLVCASCGQHSPGWELTAPMPRMRYAGDRERHQIHLEPQKRPQPRPVASRRVA